jgi:hypothetical protein
MQDDVNLPEYHRTVAAHDDNTYPEITREFQCWTVVAHIRQYSRLYVEPLSIEAPSFNLVFDRFLSFEGEPGPQFPCPAAPPRVWVLFGNRRRAPSRQSQTST